MSTTSSATGAAVSRHSVLIVDDDVQIRSLLRAVLGSADDLDVVGEADDGVAAIGMVRKLRPDVVVMDVEMPYLDGPRATERILDAHPGTRVLAYTGHVGSDPVVRMIVAGAVGVAIKGGEPDALVEAVREAAVRTVHVDQPALPALFRGVVELAREERLRRREAERLNQELQDTFAETIRALARALACRDPYTGDHDDRVAAMSVQVGEAMGLEGDDLRNLEYGAIFHDIGKIAIPDRILHGTKPQLSEEEWALIREHTVVGERIIDHVRMLRPAARIVRHSHEHWDGSGYPDGLSGTDIPLASRIVLACDAFDAMTSGRTYQRAMPTSHAVTRLRELSGTHFDPAVVDALAGVVERQPSNASGSSSSTTSSSSDGGSGGGGS